MSGTLIVKLKLQYYMPFTINKLAEDSVKTGSVRGNGPNGCMMDPAITVGSPWT
jgi:hypothetical protein